MKRLLLIGFCVLLAVGAAAQDEEAPPPGPPTPAPAPRATPPATPPAPRPAAPGAGSGRGPAAPASPATPAVCEIARADNGWTIHAVDVDAHQLLTEFAAAAQLPLVVDDTVRRRLTLNISDKPAADILNLIVAAYGFSWAEVDGVNLVSEGMPRSPSSYLLSDIASVTTQYVAPSQARQLLPVFLQGDVALNTDQNSVVLSGPAPLLAKFRQDVAQFDVPARQIMLDVNVVEFTDTDLDSFVAMLGWSNSRLGLTTDSLTGQSTLTAIAKLPTSFSADLTALVQARKARVRANPRIATLSGQSASIFIGQQQYLRIPTDTGSSIDAGVTLQVTPLTGGMGEIILDLNEEISTLSAPDPVTGLPTKTTRSAKTTVRVLDGQTIVGGGLRQAETRAVRRAIPILSDIPLIGNLFRSRKIEKTNVDLAVFITARLLSPTGHLAPEEEQELLQQAQPEGEPTP
jgi:type II secretory pathway component GspD/PulD (secretin)